MSLTGFHPLIIQIGVGWTAYPMPCRPQTGAAVASVPEIIEAVIRDGAPGSGQAPRFASGPAVREQESSGLLR